MSRRPTAYWGPASMVRGNHFRVKVGPPSLAQNIRKVVEDEKRAVGRVSHDVWELYVKSFGAHGYWAWLLFILVLVALCPIAENWWLKIWSGSSTEKAKAKGPVYYVVIYAAISTAL
ncbi:uncharacterized protein BJ212DRAFT_1486195 [Suillus subaureus]|uniref:Uncharacterized protein n=1 Tax=Suillus subaureus TaxID=48587 RepID=A0A9P7J6V3_9AGAM|nr:uncharacterized protein BJ212DRAFT_1486195 [Suillus subaureus]KAG1805856.1 hypothetical protein BJ212DRAFT_1486195 [Suillus subaureus]